VVELLRYFAPVQDGQATQAATVPAVQAVPGAGADVEVWILGSSLFGARLAAALGLPYAFASHFAPDSLEEALAEYRGRFQPSERLAAPQAGSSRASVRAAAPHVMLALNVVVADTDAEAARLFTTQQQAFVRLRRGQPGLVPPPLASAEAFADFASPAERAGVDRALACAVVGAPETVRAGIAEFVARYQPDELILTANIFDHAARLRSFEMAHGLVAA
jgi:luciferase family oxidoreductase group 1